MDSKSVVRLGVLLVLALGIVATMAGPVAASDDCTKYGGEWPCDGEERPPLIDRPDPGAWGNVSDTVEKVSGSVGNASDAIGSLLDPAGLLPLPE